MVKLIHIFLLSISLLLAIPGFSVAAETVTAYPNPDDPAESLQDLFDRLCESSTDGDTIHIKIGPGEYSEQIFTLCDKAVNVRLTGAGIGKTNFVLDDFKTLYHGIQSDRQIAAAINCVRAPVPARPDGTNACPAAGPPSFGGDICSEQANLVGPFTPFDTFCEVSNLSVKGLRNATAGILAAWNRPEVKNVEVSGFTALGIIVSNTDQAKIHHSRVSCPSSTVLNANTRQPWGIAGNVNAPTHPQGVAGRILGTQVYLNEVSNCAVALSLQRFAEGSVSYNLASDSFNGINLTISEAMELAHNRLVRMGPDQSETLLAWGIGLGGVHGFFVHHNQFWDSARGIVFSENPIFGPPSTDVTIENNLNFGIADFVVDLPPLDTDYTEDGTVEPMGSPQGW